MSKYNKKLSIIDASQLKNVAGGGCMKPIFMAFNSNSANWSPSSFWDVVGLLYCTYRTVDGFQKATFWGVSDLFKKETVLRPYGYSPMSLTNNYTIEIDGETVRVVINIIAPFDNSVPEQINEIILTNTPPDGGEAINRVVSMNIYTDHLPLTVIADN